MFKLKGQAIFWNFVRLHDTDPHKFADSEPDPGQKIHNKSIIL